MTSRSLLINLLKPGVYVYTIVIAICVYQPAQALPTAHLEAARQAVDAGLRQYNRTRSPSILRSTIYSMQGALDVGELTPSNFVAVRRQLVQSWAQIIAVTEHSYDRSFNPADPANIPQTCLMPPPDGNRRLPSCADPKDIHDPHARALYETELAKNNEVTLRWNTYQQMSQIDRLAMTSLRMQLDVMRKVQPQGAPPDFAALDNIVRSAGISDA